MYETDSATDTVVVFHQLLTPSYPTWICNNWWFEVTLSARVDNTRLTSLKRETPTYHGYPKIGGKELLSTRVHKNNNTTLRISHTHILATGTHTNNTPLTLRSTVHTQEHIHVFLQQRVNRWYVCVGKSVVE